MFQIRTMNLANSRVDIHVNLDSFSRSDFDRLRLCTHVPGFAALYVYLECTDS